MSLSTRSDLIVPQILIDAIQGEFSGMVVLQGSKAVIVNDRLPNMINGLPVKGGTKITVPYFNTMANKLQQITTEGDALIPTKLGMVSEDATVGHWGEAGELTTWAAYAAAYADPYGEMARQFKEATVRTVEAALITVAQTSLSTAGPGSTSMVNDLTVGGTVLGTTVTWDAVIDTKLKFGDEQGKIELLTVHSKVYGDMLKLKDSFGRPLLVDVNDGSLPKFAGIPVKVSDLNTTGTDSFGAYYDSMILKEAALVWWYQATPNIRGLGDPLTDADIQAIHVYGAPYRYKRTPGFTRPGVAQLRSR